jgi:phosphinothricin acetyltransferase
VIVDSGEPACLALDGSSGFVEVGRLRRVSFKLGRWVETVLMQLSLEDTPAQAPGSRVPT